nr:hypothetical protein CFP56_69054 [Quercus suber]
MRLEYAIYAPVCTPACFRCVHQLLVIRVGSLGIPVDDERSQEQHNSCASSAGRKRIALMIEYCRHPHSTFRAEDKAHDRSGQINASGKEVI